MASVQKFSRSMVEQFLRSRNYRFLRDSDDDFVLQFAYDSDADCKLTFYLMLSGKDEQIFTVHARSDKHVPKQEWGRIVMLCNTWNRQKRWPKAYLYVSESNPSPTTGEIFLEEHMDLESGIHQELLDDFTSNTILGSNLFWEWIHKEHNF